MSKPIEPKVNGRDSGGRFAAGNKFGTSSKPHASSIARWRKHFAESITDDDIVAAVRALTDAARAGERWAIKELLSRTIGDLAALDLEERIQQLEASLAERKNR